MNVNLGGAAGAAWSNFAEEREANSSFNLGPVSQSLASPPLHFSSQGLRIFNTQVCGFNYKIKPTSFSDHSELRLP